MQYARSRYNADGIMRATKLNSAGTLVLETSRALSKATTVKTNFEHFKGTFGLLAVLNTNMSISTFLKKTQDPFRSR